MQWFEILPREVQNKCTVRLERLAERGYELRRPEADLLRDGIYELRATLDGMHYRILYFFHRHRAVVWNGIVKESKVPEIQIERAIKAKQLFDQKPDKHIYTESND